MEKKNKCKLFIILAVAIVLGLIMYSGLFSSKIYDKHMGRGLNYLTNEKYEDAILSFQKAIKIKKNSTYARIYLGETYILNNEIEEATTILKEAQSLDIANEKLLMEILEILTYIDGDLAYEFLDTFVQVVQKSNISPKIQEIINSANKALLNPEVNIEPGKYVDSLQLKMLDEIMTVGHSYYYTMDGSIPNKNSSKYTGKIDISKSTNIKIIGYNKNGDCTDVETFKYIIDKDIIEQIKKSISEGESLINNTTVGSEIGNISKEDKEKLQNILNKGKDLLNDYFINYKDASNIKTDIESGISLFNDNIIKPIDKSKLESAISQANSLYNNSIEGSNVGEYKSGTKSVFISTINYAKKIYNNSSSNQTEIDSALTNLNSAIGKFKKNKITTNDRNSDGSYTREYVESYIKKEYVGYGIFVMDATYDEFYNNEKCYLISGSSNETNASGFTHPIEFFIGSKKLNKYSYSDVAW
ncbi:FN3 associated domain-containing protein [Terrisporobacter mayombei]|uniref:Tetratricopeptide repeat protein n=1 Tax=Terrisporobacter mayombei TaxID=1541 RepID=A0ABY9Q4X5_9FIRM|nr:FN3 associated domain-containing protein [Terrisporobacter mayombei]MCC3868812.1 chitobiase/beta-hexosaminidase C-terminal domain-containing protein [Terrisporobacter mayombei]WMT83058.1 hypothetical protein TEMA_35560 [Terrisporobacter mayombei]